MSTADAIDSRSANDSTHQVLLTGIEWDTYVRLRQEADDSGSHVFMVYSDGDLSIEMPNKIHEVIKSFVRSLLEMYLIDHQIDFAPLSATTWKRHSRRGGLEADECYYIQHADIADERDEVDLEIDPPPDLAVEVEVTVPLLAKLPVYARLAVPEVWHFKGWDEMQILVLDAESSEYKPSAASVAIPQMTVERLQHLLRIRREMPHRKALEACRQTWTK